MSAPVLGIVAGAGALPAQLVQACQESGRDYFVLALEGAADVAALAGVPHAAVRLGAVGEAFHLLRAHDVQELVLAGAVKRPRLSSLLPDALGAKMIARLGISALQGDDALLKKIISLLEEHGFRVVGAEAILASLLAPAGVLTRAVPDAAQQEDIRAGLAAARALGARDVGQAVVVEQGVVIGQEDAEGTDALIRRTAPLLKHPRRAVLVKAKKPQQDTRADLPTVGARTVEALHAAGFAGVAYEAGATLLLEREAAVALADQLGLFMVGV